jgi:hypothetical protein
MLSTIFDAGSQLLAIGGLNGDGIINNADLQILLIDLKAGGGSADTVPEPATNLALALGGMLLVAFARTTRALLLRRCLDRLVQSFRQQFSTQKAELMATVFRKV